MELPVKRKKGEVPVVRGVALVVAGRKVETQTARTYKTFRGRGDGEGGRH